MSTSSSRYREIIRLSAPIAGIQFAQVALTTVDLLMMGLLGLGAVAAGGLGLLLYNQLRTMGVGMVTGVGNLVAGAAGRAEKRGASSAIDAAGREEIRDLLRASLLIATATGLVAGLLLVALGHLLPFLGQDEGVVALARPIMLALAPGLVPMLWMNVLRQFAVGLRRPGSLLAVTLVSIGVNALLNAVFIYGWLGLPKLGLAGIGLSTTLVQIWNFVVYLRMIRRDAAMREFLALDGWRARRETVMRIVRMGTPISLTYGSEAAITSIASLFMGTFGPVALAASNVVNQLAYIVYQANIGLSQGTSILVSRALGRGERDEIGRIALQALTISLTLMSAIGLVYILLPEAVLLPFLGERGDGAVLTVASTLLWFAVAHQIFKGSQNICVGLLRGLGNTRAGLTNTLIGYWLIGIPAMALCAQGTGWGAYGVWFGLCLGFAATSLLLWLRFTMELRRLAAAHNGEGVPAA
ncbi:MATE family efflux transporter [Aureimonas ureilytica]|uniref:MATE family efflux transporter n=1 Tax=Aureimonas ureilytica TaxID=401562 RepID=UPI0003813A6B|nr:MATE family efflux transporter [Aureimonas ureilytica]